MTEAEAKLFNEGVEAAIAAIDTEIEVFRELRDDAQKAASYPEAAFYGHWFSALSAAALCAGKQRKPQ